MPIRNSFAVEDKNLSVSTILGTRNVQYKDIDLSFKNKTSGEIFKKQDAAAVKQAVKNLLLTNYGEKPFNPDFGGDLRSLLFELADNDLEEEIEERVIAAVNRYEPRVGALRVEAIVNPDRNTVYVTATFKIINTQEEVILSIPLARLR